MEWNWERWAKWFNSQRIEILTEWVNSVDAAKVLWHCQILCCGSRCWQRSCSWNISFICKAHWPLVDHTAVCLCALSHMCQRRRDQFPCLYLFLAAVKCSRAAGDGLWKHTLQAGHPTSAFKLALQPRGPVLHLQNSRGNPLTSFWPADVAPHSNTFCSGCKNFTVRLLSGWSKGTSTSDHVFLALCNTPDRSAQCTICLHLYSNMVGFQLLWSPY